MKKNTIILIIALCLLSVLMGCSNENSKESNTKIRDDLFKTTMQNETEYNEDDQNAGLEESEFSYSIELLEKEKNQNITHEYNGGEIEIPISYECSGKMQHGYIIMINGICQKYTTNEFEKKDILHTYNGEVKKYSTSLKFTPSIGKKGERLKIQYIIVLNSNDAVKNSNRFGMLNFTCICTQYISYKKDVGSYENLVSTKCETAEISKDLYDFMNVKSENFKGEEESYNVIDNIKIDLLDENDYIYVDKIDKDMIDNPFINEESMRLYIQFIGNATGNRPVSLHGTSTKVKLRIMNGKKENYKICIFCNNQLLEEAFDGKPYLYISTNKSTMFLKDIVINPKKCNINSNTNIYVLALSEDKDVIVAKSNALAIEP